MSAAIDEVLDEVLDPIIKATDEALAQIVDFHEEI